MDDFGARPRDCLRDACRVDQEPGRTDRSPLRDQLLESPIHRHRTRRFVAPSATGCLASGMLRGCTLALIFLAPLVTTNPATADETSAADKLRILYSTRFTFTDDGLPLVTVEIMSGKKDVHLRAK